MPKQNDKLPGSFITDIIARHPSLSTNHKNSILALFLVPLINNLQNIEGYSEGKPNQNPEIIADISRRLGLTFTNEKETEGNLCFANNPDLRDEFKDSFNSTDLFDYIYAMLYAPTYREKYIEFLKTDSPIVPYPKDASTFWKLVTLGSELRQIHLLESPKVGHSITTYPNDGDNRITTKIAKKDWDLFDQDQQLGRIWINEAQYFDNIPLTAWEFYIGGYHPAQKWLKDRKEKTLTFEDILQYQKIIGALFETDRLMKEIDGIALE